MKCSRSRPLGGGKTVRPEKCGQTGAPVISRLVIQEKGLKKSRHGCGKLRKRLANNQKGGGAKVVGGKKERCWNMC